jgi:5-methyltetrahydropteroyltriglutamate--homocysteine methyltransferase
MSLPDLPLFPLTVVGSWPRPPELLRAFRQRRAGRLASTELKAVADKAVLDALHAQEEAGVDIVSDGEQRRESFYSFVVDKLDGVRLMSLAELLDLVEDKTSFDEALRAMDAPAFAIKNPTVVGPVKPRMPLALDEYEFLSMHTDKPIKVALPGPYLLTRSMWVQGVTDSVYPTQADLAEVIVNLLRDELVRLRDAGVAFVQFDEPVLTDAVFKPEVKERTFMCASLAAASGDPTQELLWAVRLLNAVVGRIEGIKTGLHVCRGNWTPQESALLEGSYQPLLPYLMAIDVDQLVLEYATPRAGPVAAFEAWARMKELGLGVANPRSEEVESVEFVVSRAHQALDYFRPEQIYLNPDCGFGTFSERPANSAEIAVQKLKAIANAAHRLRAEYGA